MNVPACFAVATIELDRDLINAPIGPTARARFVPDSRRIVASQRNDAMCHKSRPRKAATFDAVCGHHTHPYVSGSDMKNVVWDRRR